MSSYYTGGSSPLNEESTQQNSQTSPTSQSSNVQSSTVQRYGTRSNTTEISIDDENGTVSTELFGKTVSTNYNEKSLGDSEFPFEITLSYTVKSDYQYGRWEPQVPAQSAGQTLFRAVGNLESDEFCPAGTLNTSDGPSKFDRNSDTESGYSSKTITWTIGSSLPIKYGYHLDESPWVIDNGDIHLIRVGELDDQGQLVPGDAQPRTTKNCWYEDFDVNQTCINPDMGKMISESSGQMSLEPGALKGFKSEMTTRHWAFDPYFTNRCITESRGFVTDGGPVPYSDDDSNIWLLSKTISPTNRNPSENTFGNGGHEWLWPVHFDGRGTLKSTSSIEAWNFYPRGSYLDRSEIGNPITESAGRMPDVTKDELGEDYYWVNAWGGLYETSNRDDSSKIRLLEFKDRDGNGYGFDQSETKAPCWREDAWYGPAAPEGDDDPDTNTENWNTLYTGNGSNRIDFGKSTNPANSYDEVVDNTGAIVDRDGVERWSGIWNKNNNTSRKLTAHDLVVSSISHVDPNAVSRGRRFWRARYNLYLALKGVNTEDGVYNQSTDGYNYLQFGSDANNDDSGLEVTAQEYNGSVFFPGDDYPPGVVDYKQSGGRITEWYFWWSVNRRPKYYVMPGENNSNGQITHIDVEGIERDIVSTDNNAYPGQTFYPLELFTEQGTRPMYLRKDASLNDNQYDTVQNDFIPGQGMPIYDAHGMWARAGAAWERKDYLDLLGCLSVVPAAGVPEDLNQDGIVDGADLTQILFALRQQLGGNYLPDRDLNEDGIVNGADLTLLLAAWNATTDLDYNKRFRPPINWDPTQRAQAPYMKERDDIESYTYYNEETSNIQTNIGQIGYPTEGMDFNSNGDSQLNWAKVAYQTGSPEPNPTLLDSSSYFTLADAFYPDPSYADSSSSNASNSRLDLYKGAVASSPLYLRLGTVAPWFGSAQNDEKVAGFTSYLGAANSSYGSAKGGKDEIHIALSCDRNLDFIGDPLVTEKYPSLYWLNKHFGADAEVNKKDLTTDKSDYDKFGGESFSLRKKIRRAFAQRGIDHFGGYRSLGKVSNGNGGHACWWDPLLIWGLAVTGDQEYFDMLNKGGEPTSGVTDPNSENYDRASGPGVNIGNEDNGTYKDLDFAYSAAKRNNHGTLGFMGSGSLGPNGQQCFSTYTTNDDYVKYGKRSFYSDQLIKNLSVKTVRDYDFSFRGSQSTLFNDDYDSDTIYGVDTNNKQIFKNRLVTIHPPLGTNSGNVADNVLNKLAEVADQIGYDIDTSANAARVNQCRRNFGWAPQKKEYYVNDDVEGEKLDEVYNDLKSGVDPHSVVEKDQPYSMLHSVSDDDIVTINGVKFNTWDRYDSAGNVTETVAYDHYVPHKSLNRAVGHDIRDIGRWNDQINPGDGGWLDCAQSDGYLKDIPESDQTLSEDSRSGLVDGISSYRSGSPFMDPFNNNIWARVNNKGAFNNNSYAGFYVKNMDNGKVTRILAADLEIVTYKEGFRLSNAGSWVGCIEGGPSETQEFIKDIDTRAVNEPNDNFAANPNATRALRCVLQDDIGLTPDTPVEISPYIREEVKTNLAVNFCNPNSPKNAIPARGNLTYSYAYYRGILTYAIATRMIAGLANGETPQSYSSVLEKLPVYFQRQYPKYVAMWTTGMGRFGVENNYESTFGILYLGTAGGNKGGGSSKEKDPLPAPYPAVDGSTDGTVYGDYVNLIRALFRQQLVDVLSDREVSAWYGEQANAINGKKPGSKGIALKTRLVKWSTNVIEEGESNLNRLVDANGDNVDNVDFEFPEFTLNYEDYATNGVSAICSNPYLSLFGSTVTGQNVTGWDQQDGQQVSFYWNPTSDGNVVPSMQSPTTREIGSAGAPALSKTIIGHPRVEEGVNQNKPYSVDPDDPDHGPYLVRDDSGNIVANSHIGNDGILINTIKTNKTNTGFLPYDSRVKDKSLYIWMSGLLAPIELVKIYERVDSDDEKINTDGGALPEEKVDENGDPIYGSENDRIRWRQVWAFPNAINGIPMRFFANLTEMYAYSTGDQILSTLFYADKGIE